MLRPYGLALFSLLLVATQARGAEYFVSNSGVDTGRSCATATNPATPLLTIAAGIACLSAGDTLLIRGGTYRQSIVSGTIPGGTSWTNPVTIKGYPGETVLWGATVGCHTPASQDCRFALWVRSPNERYISFEDFTVDGDSETYHGIIVDSGTTTVANQAHHIRFKNINVQNVQSNFFNVFHTHDIEILGGYHHNNCCVFFNPGPLTPVGYYINSTNGLVIDGVEIADVNGYAIQVYGANEAGKESSNITIQNSRITRSGDINGENAGILIWSDASSVNIVNNIIYKNGFAADNKGLGIRSHGSNVLIANNTITGNYSGAANGVGAIYIGSGSATVRNNILWDNHGTELVHGGGSITESNNLINTNPLFLNASGDDYHLTSGSPAINHGTDVGVTTDLDGNARVGLPDAGAYEFVTGVSPTVGTFFVAPSPTGNDTRSCDDAKGTIASPSTLPLATLNKAFTCAAGTSTIVLRQGTYTESIDTGTQPIAPGSSLTAATVIRSFPGEIATIQRTTSGIHFHFNSAQDHDIIFDGTGAPAGQYGLVIDGVATAELNLVVIRSTALRLRFQGVRFRRSYYEALFLQGSAGVEILASKIDVNTFQPLIGIGSTTGTVIRQNEITGAGSGAGIGHISSTGNTNFSIERNAIHTNADVGFSLSCDAAALIANNLIYGNLRGADILSGSSGCRIYNNTFWSNSGAPLQIDSGASTTTYRNNIFTANGSGNAVTNNGTGTVQSHNFSGDPSFTSPGPPTNFHVESLSVIGQGITLAEVTVDYFGVGRSAPYTIGATQENTPAPPALAVRGLPFATTPFLVVP